MSKRLGQQLGLSHPSSTAYMYMHIHSHIHNHIHISIHICNICCFSYITYNRAAITRNHSSCPFIVLRVLRCVYVARHSLVDGRICLLKAPALVHPPPPYLFIPVTSNPIGPPICFSFLFFFFLFFFCLSTPISQADFVYSSKSLISRPRLPNPSDETAARLGVVSIPSNRSLVAELFSEFRVTLNVDLPPAVWKRSWSCC